MIRIMVLVHGKVMPLFVNFLQFYGMYIEICKFVLLGEVIVWITLPLGLVKNKILKDVIQHERSCMITSSSVLIGRLLSFFACLKIVQSTIRHASILESLGLFE